MWICVGPRDPPTKPSRGWVRVVVRKPRLVLRSLGRHEIKSRRNKGPVLPGVSRRAPPFCSLPTPRLPGIRTGALVGTRNTDKCARSHLSTLQKGHGQVGSGWIFGVAQQGQGRAAGGAHGAPNGQSGNSRFYSLHRRKTFFPRTNAKKKKKKSTKTPPKKHNITKKGGGEHPP